MFRLLLLVAVAMTSLSAFSQDDNGQNAWMTFMQPGSEHAWLAKQEGDWAIEIKYWQPGNPEAMVSLGECTNTMVKGGRYLEANCTGNVFGMPLEGRGITGFDNLRKIYFSTWIDNMGTGLAYSEGTMDKEGVLVLKGTMTDPSAGGVVETLSKLHFEGDDKQVMKMYGNESGEEVLVMQITYTKK